MSFLKLFSRRNKPADERLTHSHPVGYEIFFESTPLITADIIFVHGLRGHCTESWTKGSICWPRDLLPNEKTLANVRILTFGYDSTVIDPSGRLSLFDHSISLLEGLCQRRRQEAGRPIIFVAHSLGGLIVKDALNRSERYRTTKPDLASILLATRGIIFLGTPHRGSGGGPLADSIASVAQAVQGMNVKMVRDLEKNSEMLDRIGDSFCQILDKWKLTVYSFVEEKPMLDGRKVVEGESGIMNDGREHWDTIDADHVNMVKFFDRKDDGYGKVLNALERLLKPPGDVESPPAGHGISETLREAGLPHPQSLLSGTTFSNINNLSVIIKNGPDLSQTTTNINPFTNYGQYTSGGKIENHGGKSEAMQKVTTFYDIPLLQVPNYVERKMLFSRMKAVLEDRSAPSLTRIVVLSGMGGAGKTQLALRYCRYSRSSRKHRAIFWLDASSRNALHLSMEAVAKKLLPDRVFSDPHEVVLLVRDILSSWTEDWLLVFDNVDDPSDLNDIRVFFPDSSHGSILVTSRCTGSTDLGVTIQVDRMDENEGLELLCRSSEVDTKERAAAQDILRGLEYLPLAIDQVRAYTLYRQLPLSNFAEDYERRKHEFMVESPRFSPYLRMLPGTKKPTTLTVMTTWEMSFNLLDVGQEKLGDVLTVFGFFHPFSISEKLFSASDETYFNLAESPLTIFKDTGHWNYQKFERAIVQMQEHSLVRFSRREKDEIVVTLHPMVSEWLQLRLKHDDGLASRYLGMAASHLVSYLKTTSQMDHAVRREVLSHMDTICRNEGFRDDDGPFTYICNQFGEFYADNARLSDAERMQNRALAGSEKAFGPDHTSTLAIVNSLGNLYHRQGRLSDAEGMHNRTLAGWVKALGPDHVFTLSSVANLGIVYADQGRLSDAEGMYSRVLAGREKAWGHEHTSTLDAVYSLGRLYHRQGRLSDAERMYNRALVGHEMAWGHGHTSTLNTVGGLGLVFADQGRLSDAEGMYSRALAGYKKALGPDHTSTLIVVHTLGNLYWRQGLFTDAERMYNCALAGQEKALGPDHMSTLHTVHNLGHLYVDQGRLSDAEGMYIRALAGREKVLGRDHAITLDTANDLGDLYQSQGRHSDAERMYNRVMARED